MSYSREDDYLCGCGYRQSLHTVDSDTALYCQVAKLRHALQSIANSACCGCCQEAALVARNALADAGAHPNAVGAVDPVVGAHVDRSTRGSESS